MTSTKPREPERVRGGITLHNRLRAQHRYHASLDRIVRLALGDRERHARPATRGTPE